MANTRRIAFAIWWKICLAWIAVSAVAGFASRIVPAGQLRFWFAALAIGLFGEDMMSWLGSTQNLDLALGLLASLLAALLIFLVINWIVARDIGRNFGGYRLTLERVE